MLVLYQYKDYRKYRFYLEASILLELVCYEGLKFRSSNYFELAYNITVRKIGRKSSTPALHSKLIQLI
jgi:hypothetical protein